MVRSHMETKKETSETEKTDLEKGKAAPSMTLPVDWSRDDVVIREDDGEY